MSRKRIVACCLSILILWMHICSNMPVVMAINDSENSFIDRNTLAVDKTEARFGEVITISIKVTNPAVIDKVWIGLKNEDTGKDVFDSMNYNQQSGLYEYLFTVDEKTPAGNWIIDSISVNDTKNNYSFYSFNKHLFYITNEMADSDKPVIDVNTLAVNKAEAELGEHLKISIKITDNVAIKRVMIQLKNVDTKKDINGDMTYNQQSGLYEYTFTVDGNVPAGNWELSNISVYDTSNNYTFCSFQKHLFHITNEIADSELPVIYKETLLFDKQEVGVGECVNISIKITDNVGISKVSVHFRNAESNDYEYVDMCYNPKNERYECRFIVSSDTTAGNWKLNTIFAYDSTDNLRMESFDDSFHVTNELTDLEQWPIYANTLVVDKDIIKVGEYTDIFIKTANSKEIAAVGIEYENIWTGKTIQKVMSYNEERGLYQSRFMAEDDTMLGNWRVNSIYVEHTSGKQSRQMLDQVFLVEAQDIKPPVPEQTDSPRPTPPISENPPTESPTKEPPITAAPSAEPSNPPKAEQKDLIIIGADNKVYGDGDFQLSANGGSTNGKVTYSVPEENGVLAIDGDTAKILNAGTVTLTAVKEGDQEYEDLVVTKEIIISPRDINISDISIKGLEKNYFYTGEEIIPALSLMDSKADIHRNDYEVTAMNNINGGTATVIIHGKNNYTGEIIKSFNIIEADRYTILGDVNCDGVISIADAQLVLKMVIHKITPYAEMKRVANVNKDQKIDLIDVQLILKKALHIINNYDDAFVESIKVSPNTATIAAGEQQTLTAAVIPANAINGQVTWKSSNNSIATVKNGVVTGISPGKVTITATAGKYSAKCTITVLPAIEGNNNKLKDYILKYGTKDSDGNRYIRSYMQPNKNEFFVGTITYIAANDRFRFECDELYETNTYQYITYTKMEYNYKQKSVTPECLYYSEKPRICLENTYTTFNAADYKRTLNRVFHLANINGTERWDSLVQIEANGILAKSFIIWDYLLVSKVGLNINKIGFTSYETPF